MRPRENLAHALWLGSADRVRCFGVVFLACLLIAPAAHAAPSAKPATKRARTARSVGAPNRGRLEGGVKLVPTPAMRFLESYENTRAHYGLPQLNGLLDRASRQVRRRFAGSVMGLGHLSLPGGGDILRHASHESGRDADVAFYAKDAKGQPVLLPTLVHFDREGRAIGHRGVWFDDARNWELIVALLGDPQVRVQHLFVAPFVRERLLAYGAKIGSAQTVRDRAARMMVQPKGAALHDDHVHVRIGCPAQMAECIEHPLPRQPRKAKKILRAKATSSAPALERVQKQVKSPTVAPKLDKPKVKPKASRKVEPLPEEEEEPEGLDRLIGPSVRGLDSIRLPSVPLFEDELRKTR